MINTMDLGFHVAETSRVEDSRYFELRDYDSADDTVYRVTARMYLERAHCQTCNRDNCVHVSTVEHCIMVEDFGL